MGGRKAHGGTDVTDIFFTHTNTVYAWKRYKTTRNVPRKNSVSLNKALGRAVPCFARKR